MSGNTLLTTANDNNEKIAAARVSIVSNGVLVILKVAVGVFSGSVAVLSEAVHSATDLTASIIAFYAVRAAAVPPDKDHPFGHGKVESLSGLLEAALIVGAAIFIIVEAISALHHGNYSPVSPLSIGVMAFSAVTNFFVVRYLFVVAKRTESPALEADARHLSVDIWTSAGVLGGLVLSHFTQITALDPIIALVISGFVLWVAFRIVREAVVPLVDTVLPEAEVQTVERILRDDPLVMDWHRLRTRKSGSYRHIDVHIQVEDDMSLREAHRLTESLEDRMRDALPNANIVIHAEPYEEEKRHQADAPY